MRWANNLAVSKFVYERLLVKNIFCLVIQRTAVILIVKLNKMYAKEILPWDSRIYLSGGTVVKNLPANAGATGDTVSISGLGRSLGGGNGNPLQYSCQENPMDRGAWWATVHGVTKSWTWLSMHAPTIFRLILNPHLCTAFPVSVTKWRHCLGELNQR